MKRHILPILAVVAVLCVLCCIRVPQASNDPSDDTAPQTDASGPSGATSTPTAASPTQPTAPLPTEPEVDLTPVIPAVYGDTFVRVKDYIPGIFTDLRYASTLNPVGRAVYDFRDAYLRYGTVEKLLSVQRELQQQGLSLKLWDAFRPASAQRLLSDASEDYTRGSAVAVTLTDETGAELAMPSDFGERASAQEATGAAGENARLLRALMECCGFTASDDCWWHFEDTARYDADDYFDPAVVSVQYANCTTSLTLRAKPRSDGAKLGNVPAGEAMILLGWQDKYAYVDYGGTRGFVSSEYLLPDAQWRPNEVLSVVRETDTYTYEQMQQDIAALAEAYPTLLRVGSIGTSELGRDLTLLIVGDPNAEHHVLIHASIHAREHMTSWVAMAITEYWLSRGMAGCEDTCFHIIPMVNPDGVTLAQTGELTEQQLSIYRYDLANGYTNASRRDYASTWKANGLGIDLNRNFDAAWKATSSRSAPSTERYKGDAPCSAAETAALRDYTLALMPDATVSCHSTGSVIYYEYGTKAAPNAASKSLGQAVRAVSGYTLVGQGGLDAGGYKDWCIDSLGIPSVTIEMGCAACPLPARELYSVFMRNVRLLPALAAWVGSY